jgi:hypothetical protein
MTRSRAKPYATSDAGALRIAMKWRCISADHVRFYPAAETLVPRHFAAHAIFPVGREEALFEGCSPLPYAR